MEQPELTIILPVREEPESLNVMLKVINALIDIPHEMIIVTDDENDSSIAAVATLSASIENVSHQLNAYGHGVLNAVKTGINAANGKYILIYAADEIGPVLAINKMLDHMRAGCNFVSGTRYKSGGKRYGGSMLGHFLSRTANSLFNLFTATALSDCTTGIKMFDKQTFESITWPTQCSGWSFAFHMAIHVQAKGLKVAEVPIVSIDRLFGGQSSFKLISWVKSYGNFFIQGVTLLPKWKKRKSQLHKA